MMCICDNTNVCSSLRSFPYVLIPKIRRVGFFKTGFFRRLVPSANETPLINSKTN
jgi:hypothetical protein